MPQNKFTVSYQGQVVGKRGTDRAYSHVVIGVDFNEAAYRVAYEKGTAHRVKSAKSTFAFNAAFRACKAGEIPKVPCRAGERPWQWPARQEDIDGAVKYFEANPTIEAAVANELARHQAFVDKAVKGLVGKVAVFAWCGRPDLAAKQVSKIQMHSPYYRVLVAPVDQRIAVAA